eukprot:1065982-Rhodomonas_salina.1
MSRCGCARAASGSVRVCCAGLRRRRSCRQGGWLAARERARGVKCAWARLWQSCVCVCVCFADAGEGLGLAEQSPQCVNTCAEMGHSVTLTRSSGWGMWGGSCRRRCGRRSRTTTSGSSPPRSIATSRSTAT